MDGDGTRSSRARDADTAAVEPRLPPPPQDSAYQTEVCAFLQRRLTLVTAVLGLAGLLLLVVSRISDAVKHGFVWERQTHPSVLIHLGVVLVAGPLYVFLRRTRLSARGLLAVDGIIMALVVGACLAIYAFSYRTGIHQLVPILALLIVTHAVVIPARPLRTILLSLPAAAGILVVQLAHGRVYTLDGEVFPPQGFHAYVLWDQAILLLSILVAALTSRVIYGLNVRALEASRLGRYQLEALIGEGAIGKVYRARHAFIRRPVALKILRPDLAGDESFDRFEKEVQRTSELDHPNTVRIHDYGLTGDGQIYYAMEYLDGADLDRVVRVAGPLSPARTIHVLAQVCGALDEAHGVGLIHCDLKPANLMLCMHGGAPDVVKVLDFGLARRVASGTDSEEGGAFGTPLTMAPEVIRGEQVGPGIDLYALGVVGYLLATGRPPFEGRTVGEVLTQHLGASPIHPAEVRSGVPRDLGDRLLRCLEKDARARPPSARALAESLAECRDAGAWSEADARGWWGRYGSELRGG